MKRLTLAIGLCWFGMPGLAPAVDTFAGKWQTTFGPMTLTQTGNRVRGTYEMGSQLCTIAGELKGQRFTFHYQEPDAAGEGFFELAARGQTFSGKWRVQGTVVWLPWEGRRIGPAEPPSLEGLWDSTYGRLRLVRNGTGFTGIYSLGGGSTLEGKMEGKHLVFRYQEAHAAGEGWFELAADGQSFVGKWRPLPQTTWSDWTGRRVEPKPDRLWLVVVEARWEGSLAEREYAFGKMLKAFFARSHKVEVRHRFFTDEASLKRWCGEIAFLPESVVLVLATHGSGRGISVDGKTIGPRALADSLRYAGNLRLIHFSSCEILKDRFGHELLEALNPMNRCPISGYATSVDWAASAIIEFTYLDMILMRGINPARAADQVGKLLPFAGDKPITGGAFPAAKFRLLVPGPK